MDMTALVQRASDNRCSDIHLTAGEVPVFRRHGSLTAESSAAISGDDILALAPRPIDKDAPWQDLDFAADMAGRRLRVNIYRQSGKPAAAIRLLSDEIPTLESLDLPPSLRKVAGEPNGLILITGPTGSGKSTTLAAMIDYIANSRDCHIITIEDPIEYVYGSTRSLIHQRELGRDVPTFAHALRSALREDPDVILLGEMRDYETISAAVTAAETGHLVLSTLHTTGAARTVDRIIDVFPSEARAQIRIQLAGILRAVMTQLLIPLADGSGRKAATEIMIGTDAVSSLIRENKSHQLGSVIQSGANQGMHTMEACLADYLRRGLIDMEDAKRCTQNPAELDQILKFRQF